MNILTCKNCSAALSGPLNFLDGKNSDVGEPAQYDGRHVVKQGTIYQSHRPWFTKGTQNDHPLEFTPQLWMNVADLLGADNLETGLEIGAPSNEGRYVRLTKDISRLQGCCGFNGCDGPNVICDCGEYIGTKINDCNMPHLFIPQPNMTFLEDAL